MNENDYIDSSTIIALDIEWSDFLRKTPEQMGSTIAHGNRMFAKQVKRHLIKMSIKYKISLLALIKRYD